LPTSDRKLDAFTDSDTFGSRLAAHLEHLQIPRGLPQGFDTIDAYHHDDVHEVVREFCRRYYSTPKQRLAVWGINPGRFGAGVTGLPFTDPHALQHQLGIASQITGRRELSAEFIEMVIGAYGGPTKFYDDIYLGAVCPIGFTSNGKNINFYDDKQVTELLAPFIINNMSSVVEFGTRKDRCVVLGTGTFKKVFEERFREKVGYTSVTFVEHPRFIMQYRRRTVNEYIDKYLKAFAE